MLRWGNWRLRYVGVQDRALKICPILPSGGSYRQISVLPEKRISFMFMPCLFAEFATVFGIAGDCVCIFHL